jgi:general secretion pathway protein C
MLARLSAFVTWALVAAALVFWGMRLLVASAPAPAYVVAVGESSIARGDLNRLFGTAATAAASAAVVDSGAGGRFRLLGIMAPKRDAGAAPSGVGVALLTVDGKMPKAYTVGSQIDVGLVLQSVSLRTASIGPAQGAAVVTLEMPRPTPAATGTLGAGTPVHAVPLQPLRVVPPVANMPPPGGQAAAATAGASDADAQVQMQINTRPGVTGNRVDPPPAPAQ